MAFRAAVSALSILAPELPVLRKLDYNVRNHVGGFTELILPPAYLDMHLAARGSGNMDAAVLRQVAKTALYLLRGVGWL